MQTAHGRVATLDRWGLTLANALARGAPPPNEPAENNGGRPGVIVNPMEWDKGHSLEAHTLA